MLIKDRSQIVIRLGDRRRLVKITRIARIDGEVRIFWQLDTHVEGVYTIAELRRAIKDAESVEELQAIEI